MYIEAIADQLPGLLQWPFYMRVPASQYEEVYFSGQLMQGAADDFREQVGAFVAHQPAYKGNERQWIVEAEAFAELLLVLLFPFFHFFSSPLFSLFLQKENCKKQSYVTTTDELFNTGKFTCVYL